MKRHFLFLLLVFGVLGLNAQTFTYGDLNYEVNYGGTSVTVLEHVDGTDATGTLTIPDHVIYNGNSYAVTIIDSYAFSYCRGLEGTLVLPMASRALWWTPPTKTTIHATTAMLLSRLIVMS